MKMQSFRKLLSVFVCLCILFAACACAAEEKPAASDSAPESTEQDSALSPDAGSQWVSDASSGTGSEPFVPNLTVPEERETVLEHMATVATGIDGAFEYGFLYAEAGPASATIETPLSYCVDEAGNVYADWGYDGQGCILRLNDGARFLYPSSQYATVDMVSCGESVFVSYLDGSVYEFSMEGGFENCCLKEVYTFELPDGNNSFLYLLDIGEDRPLLRVITSLDPIGNGEWSAADDPIGEDSFLFYLEKEDGKGTLLPYLETFYTLEWERLPAFEAPYIPESETVDGDCAVMRSDASGPYRVAQNCHGDSVLCLDGNGICLSVGNYIDGRGPESIYCSYDAEGNLLSKVKITEISGGYLPCSIPFTQSGGGEVTEYFADTVTVGEDVFEDVLDAYTVCGRGGALYLVLYYPNEVQLYRIEPGYSDVRLSDFTVIEESEGF